MIRVPEMKIPPPPITDDIIRAAMAPFIRSAEPRAEVQQVSLSDSEMRLLKDIALATNSGVVARYTRLGLSGRQGDKAKRSLIEQGLIEETERLTPKGRTKSIRLTTSGKRILSEREASSQQGLRRESVPFTSAEPSDTCGVTN